MPGCSLAPAGVSSRSLVSQKPGIHRATVRNRQSVIYLPAGRLDQGLRAPLQAIPIGQRTIEHRRGTKAFHSMALRCCGNQRGKRINPRLSQREHPAIDAHYPAAAKVIPAALSNCIRERTF